MVYLALLPQARFSLGELIWAGNEPTDDNQRLCANRKETHMSLKSTRVFLALTTLVSVVLTSRSIQAVESDAAQWRTSFDTFVKAIDEFPLADVPICKPDAGEFVGERVSSDAAIMKRFGGKVEFGGIFQGIVTVESPPQHKREKIDSDLAWPAGLSSNTTWRLHLYPKAGSLKAWRALKPKTTIKFRAVVTGISMYHPWIPGANVRTISILLEDGKIVSQ
jgi:hypothetical protein